MSSKSRTSFMGEAWAVLICMILVTLWYAGNQLLYSLYFVYQIARILLPGVVPAVGPL
jgi:hypothetical protein